MVVEWGFMLLDGFIFLIGFWVYLDLDFVEVKFSKITFLFLKRFYFLFYLDVIIFKIDVYFF